MLEVTLWPRHLIQLNQLINALKHHPHGALNGAITRSGKNLSAQPVALTSDLIKGHMCNLIIPQRGSVECTTCPLGYSASSKKNIKKYVLSC